MKKQGLKYLLLLIVILLISSISLGSASWVVLTDKTTDTLTYVNIQQWLFDDSDFAKIGNISGCSFLTATQETSIVLHGSEAVRLTNTAGKQTKAHSFIVSFDRDYTVGEIKFLKIEFDYYYAQKREQAGKGFPKVQLLYNNSNKGSDQGGTDTVNDKSPFIATNISDGWWHLEYFITALVPTMADHQDTPISESTKINGVRITDSTIYDFNSTTAFIVIDNLIFGSNPSDRLGLFNRTTSFSSGTYYWAKICWSGELHSVTITFDDDTIAEHDTASTKSPFYIKGLKPGTVTFTATLVVGDDMRVLTISNTITVT